MNDASSSISADRYAEVLIPLALAKPLTYRIPERLSDRMVFGARVVVPLGKNRFYAGIVTRTTDQDPGYRNLKEVVSLVDEHPVLTLPQWRLWQWIADYYLCTPGEVMKAAVPGALKSKGTTAGIRSRFRMPAVPFAVPGPAILSDDNAAKALNSLRRAKAQAKAFAAVMEHHLQEPSEGIRYSVLRDEFSAAVLSALRKKGLIEIEERETRAECIASELPALPPLTTVQREVSGVIGRCFRDGKHVLLHGVTGSGKTEIYAHFIREILDSGKDALYLLPEIAVTAQLVTRLKKYFGERVRVYHSRAGDAERARLYLELAETDRPPLLLLGVRSSVLLPFHRLGLIVVDEEHDPSYKQSEPAPRYHARDTAVVLGQLHSAPVLFGSATPSVETYHNAASGKYGLASLSERYTSVSLPEIHIQDILRAAKRGEKISHFTRFLLRSIEETVENGQQVILFQNRRGFAPYLECGSCARIPVCLHCNVSLTYHKSSDSLQCHYCGHTEKRPVKCPGCGSADLKPMGFGTEKIEEELARLIPGIRLERLDLDSVKTKSAYDRILTAFANGRIDVLIGTQMVTKGFDFGNVSLVGVLNADNLLNYPDFRAAERSFQLLTQVAGRAGRRSKQGQVVIQTSQSDHPIIGQVQRGDYEAMFRSQLAERKRFLYPPFCRMIRFHFRHSDRQVLIRAANEFAKTMRAIFGRRLLGPEFPAVDKIRGEYLVGFLLKIEREKSFAEARKLSEKEIERLVRLPGFSTLRIVPDVEPY